MLAEIKLTGEPRQKLALGAAAILAVTLILVLFYDTSVAIVSTWYRSSSYNHAFLIIPICVYLAWQRRWQAAAAVPSPSPWGLVAVLLASLAWLVAHIAGTLVVQEISLVCMVQGVVLAIYGWEICRIFAFPLLYLFFAVPMGDALVPPLQAETARLAVVLLRISGIPVFADGNLITIPTGSFQVAEECSGVRFLIASVALGTLFAGLTYRSWWRRLGFVALSAVIPVFANGARAFGIILLAYVSNNELAVGIDHVVYGWIFFTAISLVTLAIGMALRERGGPSSVSPVRQWHSTVGPHLWRRSLFTGGVAVVLAAAVHGYAVRIDRPRVMQTVTLAIPEVREPWTGDASKDRLTPVFASPDAQLDRAYVMGDRKAYLHIGYYLYERRGAEVVSYGHTLVPDKRWVLSSTGTTRAPLEGEEISLQYERVVFGRMARSVWFWYWVDGRFTGNPYVAKLLQAKAKLLGSQSAAAIIVVASDDEECSGVSEKTIRGFLSSLIGLKRTLAGNP